MKEKYNCEFCNTKLKYKRNLLSHQKTNKKCLQTQGKTCTKIFSCKFCDKSFNRNSNKNVHEKTCKSNTIIYKPELDSDQEEIADKDEYIKKLKSEIYRQNILIQNLKKDKLSLLDRITFLENRNVDRITFLENRIEELDKELTIEENRNEEIQKESEIKIQELEDEVHILNKNIKNFKCVYKNCDFESKNRCYLKNHMWYAHNIGEGEIFKCNEKDCNFETKHRLSLKRHLEYVHDIGDFECQICFRKVSKLVPDFIDTNVKNNSQIIKNACKDCYRRITGFSTKIEKQMVEFIEKDELISPYIYSKDAIIRGNECNTKRRPDLVISSTKDLILIVECDENQHMFYNSECEMGRIDEILDELKNCRVIFIRWNPDKYIKDNEKTPKNRDIRLKELKTLIHKLITSENNDYTMIYYMYYNKDNPVISTRHSYKLIY